MDDAIVSIAYAEAYTEMSKLKSAVYETRNEEIENWDRRNWARKQMSIMTLPEWSDNSWAQQAAY